MAHRTCHRRTSPIVRANGAQGSANNNHGPAGKARNAIHVALPSRRERAATGMYPGMLGQRCYANAVVACAHASGAKCAVIPVEACVGVRYACASAGMCRQNAGRCRGAARSVWFSPALRCVWCAAAGHAHTGAVMNAAQVTNGNVSASVAV